MKIVGLTGGIGAGKSTVARMLVEKGARLIDADVLARQVVEPEAPAWKDIVSEFGQGVLNPDRTLNREALAAVVFENEQKRQRINQITHPRIGRKMLEMIRGYKEQGASITIIDAALLLESSATRWIKPVIVVVADDEVKIKRVCERDGCTPKEVLKRIKSQWPDRERASLADYVIDNSGDYDSLHKQVDKLWENINKEQN